VRNGNADAADAAIEGADFRGFLLGNRTAKGAKGAKVAGAKRAFMASSISGKTQLIGVIGWPVGHSFSPAMHNAAAADLGLDFVYVAMPVEPEHLAAAVRGLPAIGFRGFNVTVPHKEKVMPLLDEVDTAAQAVGAVNTVVIQREGRPRLVGYNTDWSGFMADVQEQGVEVQGQECLVLGAGGSARGVAYGLASAGGRVHLFARRIEQGWQLVQDLAGHVSQGQILAYDWQEIGDVCRELAAVSLIVNTTPVGMTPQVGETPWPAGVPFPKGVFVYDLVYNPAETRLVREARTAGCRAVTGLGMLLHQGAQAFRLWTGHEPDRQVMAKVLYKG
jgi:shikimate dehydrogenase